MVLTALLAAALALVPSLQAGPGDPWRQAGPDHLWRWPRDFYAHPEYKTEWWYFTGHLWVDGDPAAQGRSGAHPQGRPETQPLGFQLTFFRLGMIPPQIPLPQSDLAARSGLMAHAAVSDPVLGRHVFSETLWRAAPLLGGFGDPGDPGDPGDSGDDPGGPAQPLGPADSTLVWCLPPGGTSRPWRLTFDGRWFGLSAHDDRQDLGYDLRCRPLKPVVLHGDRGFSAKHPSGTAGSLYASFTRMEVVGTVRRGGRDLPVRGVCWMDREIFTNTLATDQTGWDWVSVQLDDGRDLMLYRLFGPGGSGDYASGTLVAPDGTTIALTGADFRLEPLGDWTSPHTGTRYPARWRVTVPAAALAVELRALLPDQENLSARTGVHYWEGAVTVHPDGAAQEAPACGRGFLEMVGYGQGGRPPV